VDDKTIEVLLLRQQLLILRRQQRPGPSISQGEKFMLLTLLEPMCRFACAQKTRLEQLVLIFKPDTLLGWHRALVKKNGRLPTLRRRRVDRQPSRSLSS